MMSERHLVVRYLVVMSERQLVIVMSERYLVVMSERQLVIVMSERYLVVLIPSAQLTVREFLQSSLADPKAERLKKILQTQ